MTKLKNFQDFIVLSFPNIEKLGIKSDSADYFLNYQHLDGSPMEWTNRQGETFEYHRPRYSKKYLQDNPHHHKYANFSGQPQQLYFTAFNKCFDKSKVDYLIISEGEKDAINLNLHGKPCIGIQGIHGLTRRRKEDKAVQEEYERLKGVFLEKYDKQTFDRLIEVSNWNFSTFAKIEILCNELDFKKPKYRKEDTITFISDFFDLLNACDKLKHVIILLDSDIRKVNSSSQRDAYFFSAIRNVYYAFKSALNNVNVIPHFAYIHPNYYHDGLTDVSDIFSYFDKHGLSKYKNDFLEELTIFDNFGTHLVSYNLVTQSLRFAHELFNNKPIQTYQEEIKALRSDFKPIETNLQDKANMPFTQDKAHYIESEERNGRKTKKYFNLSPQFLHVSAFTETAHIPIEKNALFTLRVRGNKNLNKSDLLEVLRHFKIDKKKDCEDWLREEFKNLAYLNDHLSREELAEYLHLFQFYRQNEKGELIEFIRVEPNACLNLEECKKLVLKLGSKKLTYKRYVLNHNDFYTAHEICKISRRAEKLINSQTLTLDFFLNAIRQNKSLRDIAKETKHDHKTISRHYKSLTSQDYPSKAILTQMYITNWRSINPNRTQKECSKELKLSIRAIRPYWNKEAILGTTNISEAIQPQANRPLFISGPQNCLFLDDKKEYQNITNDMLDMLDNRPIEIPQEVSNEPQKEVKKDESKKEVKQEQKQLNMFNNKEKSNKQRILEWRLSNPNGKQKECIEILGISKRTVERYWNPKKDKKE